MALSRERIRDELLKLLVATNAVAVLMLMVERGILLPVLPEVDADGVARLAALATRETYPDALRRLVALVPDPVVLETVGARLKLSNVQRKRLSAAAAPMAETPPRALAYRLGVESATDRLLLAGADPSVIDSWSPPTLPITGGALVARGLRKGPVVAATLRRIEDRWVEDGFPDESRVAVIVDEEIDQALRSTRNA